MKFARLIKEFFHKYKKNTLFGNIAIITSGTVIARFIGLITAPILTRLFLPEDYGILSIYTAIIGVTGTIATLRYAVAIPLAEKEEQADDLLRLSFLIATLLAIVFFLSIVFFGDIIVLKFEIPAKNSYLWILPISFYLTGIYEGLSYWATRHKLFKLITKTSINQAISSRVIRIVLGFLGIRPFGLLVGLIVSQGAGSETILRRLHKDRPTFFKQLNWENIKSVATRYIKFPVFQTWSQFLLGFATNLPVILLATYYGNAVVGYYGLAHNMVNLPMALFGSAISQVYYAEISKYGKNKKAKIYFLTKSIVKKLFFVTIIPAAILIIAGPWLFSTFFGQNWYIAGEYARLLASIILFRFVSSPIMQCLNVLEKQGIQMLINIARTLFILIIFYIAFKLQWTPKKAILLYSLFMSGFYLFVIVVVLRILKQSNKSNTEFNEKFYD